MRTEPSDLDRVELESFLERHWSFRAASLEYLPVGFGSHHWEAVDQTGSRRFVTVDRLTTRMGADPDAAFAAFGRAFTTAAALRDTAGLDFVVGPLADADGSFTRRLGELYAVTVFPFVAGRSTAGGAYTSDDDRLSVLRMLGALHQATPAVPPDLAVREDFAVPSQDSLVQALADLERPWMAGPFGEPARELLRRSASGVARLLERYEKLAIELRGGAGSWVVTHGEPHSANVIRDEQGSLCLVDWDTVKLGPRERDLWMVLDRDANGWPAYASTAGPCELDSRALQLYRRWWDLAEIAEYIRGFRHPHERTADTEAAWGYLAEYLPPRER